MGGNFAYFILLKQWFAIAEQDICSLPMEIIMLFKHTKLPRATLTPTGEVACCPKSQRLRIEFVGWRKPYVSKDVALHPVCVEGDR
jgi:hypothetical protein